MMANLICSDGALFCFPSSTWWQLRAAVAYPILLQSKLLYGPEALQRRELTGTVYNVIRVGYI